MHLEGYRLQVLIENLGQMEYVGPRKNVPYHYTSPNWVDNSQTGVRMESEFLHYILTPSSTFTVQVSSSEASYLKPMIAEIRINGIPTHETTTTFFPSSLNPKGLTLNNSENKQQVCRIESQERQLIGAISVFFYKAESLLQKKSEVPLAVLHLHYRPEDILTDLIQNKVLSEYFEGQEDSYNKENNKIKVEEKSIPFQIIKQEEDSNAYFGAFSEEPLRQFQSNEMIEQIRYDDDDMTSINNYYNFIEDFPSQPEIIEIPDD